jgi:hypothetical protein
VLGIDESGDGKTVMLSDEQDLMALLKPSSIDRSRVLNRGDLSITMNGFHSNYSP